MRHASDVGIGETVAGRRLELSLARILAFSGGPLDQPGWPERNLHTNPAAAREAGLDAIIASGTQSEGLLVAFLIATFGSTHWYRGGRLDVRFLKPVHVGDVVQPKLRWIARQEVDGGVLLSAECWCELQNGERVIAGSASCSVPEAPASCPESS